MARTRRGWGPVVIGLVCAPIVAAGIWAGMAMMKQDAAEATAASKMAGAASAPVELPAVASARPASGAIAPAPAVPGALVGGGGPSALDLTAPPPSQDEGLSIGIGVGEK